MHYLISKLTFKIVNALQVLCFHYHFYKISYAKAIAALDVASISQAKFLPKILWAYYQLGMYSSVVRFNYIGSHWRGQFASIVSMAACGHSLQATQLLDAMARNSAFNAKCNKLSEVLAPFDAELALKVLKLNLTSARDNNVNKSHPLLYAALLLKLNQTDDAMSVLNTLEQSYSNKLISPETNLLMCNALQCAPMQQLTYLNAFLQAYKLSPLTLKAANISPSATNLELTQSLAKVKGPLVSVLMTTYNSASFLVPAVESLLAQTYENLEIIIVDDASTDGTVSIIENLATQHANIKYFVLPLNAGTYVAKTMACNHANGEFITCHDSDDWSHPERIARQMAPLLNNPHLVATTSNWVRIQDNGMLYARGAFPLMRLNPASPLFRKSKVLAHTGTWDLVKTGADSEFLARLKLVFGRKSIQRVAEPLCLGAHRAGSLMTAQDTGYTTDGSNNNRLDYWEAWGHWHIDMLKQGKMPAIASSMNYVRSFDAPQALQVSDHALSACLELTNQTL